MVRPSIQKKLTRVRSPRLQTSYDLKIGDAIELHFLPGLPGDSGYQATESLSQLNVCRFIDVNVDNFDSVIQNLKPCLTLSSKFIEQDGIGDRMVNFNLQVPNDDSSGNGES